MTNALHEVIERWINDPEFKKNFKLNPQKALETAGFELSEADLKKILKTISQQEELEKKINK